MINLYNYLKYLGFELHRSSEHINTYTNKSTYIDLSTNPKMDLYKEADIMKGRTSKIVSYLLYNNYTPYILLEEVSFFQQLHFIKDNQVVTIQYWT